MIEFALGTLLGAMTGYAARAWLSARRRRAARRARITGGDDSGFVPYKSENEKAEFNEQARSRVVPLQPNRSDDSQEIKDHSRAELTFRV